MPEHLMSDRAEKNTVPKELEKGIAAGISHDFIQLLVYLHFGKCPFAAERLFEPHRKIKICCKAALKCNNTPSDMLACPLECFAFNPARIRAILPFPHLLLVFKQSSRGV